MTPRSRFVRELEALYDQQVAEHLAAEMNSEAAHGRAYIATVEAGQAALAQLRGTEHDPLGEEAGDA